MKYEFKITDEAGNVFLYDVSRSSSDEEKLKEKNVAQKKENIVGVVYEPNEILHRLKIMQYDTREFICRSYQVSQVEYERLCDIFVGEKTVGNNELKKNFGEVIAHFKSWVRLNHEKLKIKMRIISY